MDSLLEVVNRFIDYLVSVRGYSENTAKAYRVDLSKFVKFLKSMGVEPDLSKVDIKLLDRFVEHLKKQGLKSNTVSRIISAVRSFYRYLVTQKIIDRNPAELLDYPEKVERVPDALSYEEVDKLLNAPDTSTPKGMRDKAMLELLYATGMRVSELLGLKLGDVDLDERIVRCQGKGARERLVPFGDHAAKALEDYLSKARPALTSKRRTSYLFVNAKGGKLSRTGFWKILKDYGEKIGLGYRLHPHLLRHTFATHMLAGGCDIMVIKELLGHASISTTEVYTRRDLEGLKKVLAECHPRG